MFDLHAHIIFGVDDGPEDLSASLDLLGLSYAQGVRHIVATSHRRQGLFEATEVQILDHFFWLQRQAKALFPDLTLYYGGELYYTSSLLPQLERQEVPTMNGTRFVLIEFSANTSYKAIHQAVSRLSLLGLTPIIAHIERYDALAFDEKKLNDLLLMGAYTQINSVSLLTPKLISDPHREMKKRARFFLDKNLVHLIASDMHNVQDRPPYMAQAFERVSKIYGQARADALFLSNPQTLLRNDYL